MGQEPNGKAADNGKQTEQKIPFYETKLHDIGNVLTPNVPSSYMPFGYQNIAVARQDSMSTPLSCCPVWVLQLILILLVIPPF